MSECYTGYYKSEIGTLEVVGSAAGIQAINFADSKEAPDTPVPPGLQTCFDQLSEYFAGGRQKFLIKLNLQGTDFQKSVWQELLKIPYGKTVSYLDVARALGKEKAIRAVGAANGRNPVPIIVPCHRVIGSDGSLVGFGGGIWRKEFLLRHEGAIVL